ncbi:MAG: hypothetical protein K8R86_12115, partial [Bacteroidales bacterium]|nr:hypothetical protein [Bacteroidales bacterium]
HFTDLSTGSPTSWEWDFQNNGTIDSYDQNPDWVYAVSGIYTVSLRVSDGLYSVFSSKDDYIIVVDCDPIMTLLPNSLDFGVNEIDPVQDTLTSWLKNTSNCQLYLNSLFGLQPPYSYDTTNLSGASLLPGDSIEILVILNKDFAAGTYTDTLIIANSASPNFDFEDGLVAWYPFNGNANDESGNGHNANAQGAQLSTDRFGNNNSAYDFDGHDDWISAGNWFTYQDFTISVWVKQDALNSNYVDIIDNNHGYDNWVIQYNYDIDTYVFFTAPLGATAFTLPNNEWKHIVCIKDGVSLKTYMNGVLQDEITATDPTVNYSNPYLNIGRWGGGGRNFNGMIDDIRMYDRGLTEDEVDALYNENNGIEGYPQLIVQAELIESVGLEVDITAFFEGPFNGTTMNADLNNILPIEQPYNVYPWEYNGGENVASIPNSDIVDWLLVEFRDAADVNSATSATSLGGQAAFILRDGSIVDLNGSSILSFDYTITQNLFIILWHRNHLPAMSKYPLNETGGIYTYDFTTAADQAFGNNQSDFGGGKFGMIAGDANADGTINDFDGIEAWYPQIGQSGYLSGDVNMDGQVNNPDKNDVWLPNYGKSEQLPAE